MTVETITHQEVTDEDGPVAINVNRRRSDAHEISAGCIELKSTMVVLETSSSNDDEEGYVTTVRRSSAVVIEYDGDTHDD